MHYSFMQLSVLSLKILILQKWKERKCVGICMWYVIWSQLRGEAISTPLLILEMWGSNLGPEISS